MAEWGAQPQNYHIKPGFPQTLWGARAVDTDSDEREKKKKEYYEDQGAQTMSDHHCYLSDYGASIPFHLLPYLSSPRHDGHYARSSNANFPNI